MNQNVLVCFDAGASLSKIIYSTEEKKVKYITMGPEVLQLPKLSSTTLPTNYGLGKPEDNAWIKFSKKSQDFFLIGRLAREYQASVSIKQLKYESIIPKILAVLGVICSREDFSSLDLDLVTLIPLSEFDNRHDIENEIKKYIKKFYFCNREIKVNLKSYHCYPECFGLVKKVSQNIGLKEWRRGNKIFLMFGFRNTSMLVFQDGTLSRTNSNTTQLGFYDFIDKFTRKVPGLRRLEVEQAIYTKITSFELDILCKRKYDLHSSIELETLVKSPIKERASKELEKLKMAFDLAMNEYWQIIEQWLRDSFPPKNKISQVSYSGGASALLKSHFENFVQNENYPLFTLKRKDFFSNHLSLNYDEHKIFLKDNLDLRFADIWGVFNSIPKSSTEEK